MPAARTLHYNYITTIVLLAKLHSLSSSSSLSCKHLGPGGAHDALLVAEQLKRHIIITLLLHNNNNNNNNNNNDNNDNKIII